MESLLQTYSLTVLSFGLTGGLILVQLLISDVYAILARHVPGTPVEPNHENPLFRAHRAHANTNESVAAFILVVLFALAVSANAFWLNTLSITYVLGRVGHMLCYYANWKILRSVFFTVSLVAIFGILGLGVQAWWV